MTHEDPSSVRVFEIGSWIAGRFRLTRLLGKGGLASAYLAHDALWSRDVALKLVTGISAALLEVIHLEFDLLSTCYHPCLAQVHDLVLLRTAAVGSAVGEAIGGGADVSSGQCLADGGAIWGCCYSAEYVPGEPLGVFARGRPWAEVRPALCDALRALGHLHALGIRHGDFKPDNILVTGAGRGVLIDLSCARPLARAVATALASRGSRADEHAVSGTPGFLAPEQLEGGPGDERADLFAVGVTLGELCTSPSWAPPEEVLELARRLREPEPTNRPSCVEEVLEALEQEPASTHPVRAVLGRLVGRASELEAARRALDALAAPLAGEPPRDARGAAITPTATGAPEGARTQTLHFVGTDGSGRSRLLREIKWQAQHRFDVREASPAAPGSVARLAAEMALANEPNALTRIEAPKPSAWEGLSDRAERAMAQGQSPTVVILDDAHRLAAEEHRHLRDLVASCSSLDRVLLVVASDEGLTLDASRVERVALTPLRSGDIERWLGETVSVRTRRQIERLTDGWPGLVRNLLDELAAGALAEEDLGTSSHARRSPARPSRVSRRRAAIVTEGGAPDDGRRAARAMDRLRALTPSARRALGLLAAWDDPIAGQHLDELSIDREGVGELSAQGFVRAGESGIRLRAEVDRGLVLDELGSRRECHARLARWTEARIAAIEDVASRSALTARCVAHLVAAGEPARAAKLAGASRDIVSAAPAAWRSACDELDQATRPRVAAQGTPPEGHDVELLLALIEMDVGLLERASKRLSAPALGGSRLRLARAECALRLGDLSTARASYEQLLEPMDGVTPSFALAAAAHEGLARIALRAGEHRTAWESAGRAVELLGACTTERLAAEDGWLDATALRVDARQSAALAASGLGDRSAATNELGRALDELGDHDDPRRRARVLGARAVIAYEAGQLEDAAADHRAALAIVEEHALGDRIANAALNLGTVCHQQGRWAEALDGYTRGLRAALRAGQWSTVLILRFDLAKLYADLGLLDRASRMADVCLESAREGDDAMMVAASSSVLAEVALARGDGARAKALAERAREGLQKHGSRREQAEIELQLADAWMGIGTGRDPDPAALRRAEAHVQAAASLLRGLEAFDVELRLALSGARLAAYRGQLPTAAETAEHVAEQAEHVGLSDLAAEASAWAARAWSRMGAATVAAKRGAMARELWERGVARLAPTFQAAFWKHPRRAVLPHEAWGRADDRRSVSGPTDHEGELPAPARPPAGARRGGSSALARTVPAADGTIAADGIGHVASLREQRLERLLAINKRLNSTLETSGVLELAMDAAIDLSGAERGFVLLTTAHERLERTSGASKRARASSRTARDALRIAVARNLGGAQLDSEHRAFSRAIAEEVLASGEPLVTADAQADGRFASGSSVHLMHLKSVACVPVVSPRGILGALYLDNRYQRGRFDTEDLDVLLAFADQVAIALDNAQLHDELRKRNAELELERQRVEQLAQGQAEEIDRLNAEVRRVHAVREHRFDYRGIVGQSRALERVLTLLDRIIDTDLPVLVQGESGTGKELVVRAIHHNSPRSKHRLVAINCAALPENLLESELFGYERGAFTGAERARDGLVVQAAGGTLFLDEIGEMPTPMQAKLLRVLQQREVQPLGSSRIVPVDFRLVCATNRRLREEVTAGRFREDLYYRLSAVEIAMPPLRDRAEDIPELATVLLERVAEQLRRPKPDLARAALRKLVAYDWPGNVRQLEHVLTKAAALAEAGRIEPADVELPAAQPAAPDHGLRGGRQAHRAAELSRISESLEKNRWNVAKVARELGIPRATLYRRMRAHGIANGPRRSA